MNVYSTVLYYAGLYGDCFTKVCPELCDSYLYILRNSNWRDNLYLSKSLYQDVIQKQTRILLINSTFQLLRQRIETVWQLPLNNISQQYKLSTKYPNVNR